MRQRLALSSLVAVLATLAACTPAFAQAAGGGGSAGLGALAAGWAPGKAIQLILLLTVLSLAPGILMTVTSFTRIVVALSLLRNGIGAPGVPPNPVLISLAMFLSFFVMAPTFEVAWKNGIQPYNDGRITEEQAFNESAKPFRQFMLKHVRSDDLKLFADMTVGASRDAGVLPQKADGIPLSTLVPAFMISELRRAFEIGFLLLLPFLIIDLAVSAVLMAMGMMMLPPPIISLPMKIIFFVLVDGWALVAGSLVRSFQ
jgi:flagellar biosynthetic protein FliP